MQITIPETVTFADLKLERDPITGDVSFDWEPIEAICEASGIDVAIFKEGPADNVSGLIATWYAAHRSNGGAPDPVQDQLLAEIHA